MIFTEYFAFHVVLYDSRPTLLQSVFCAEPMPAPIMTQRNELGSDATKVIKQGFALSYHFVIQMIFCSMVSVL